MPKRYQETSATPFSRLRPCIALRTALRQGYSKSDFFSDLQAGVIVALVAIPLAMALAIAVGVAPQYGLYTAIIAGFLTALLGGSMNQVTGPTAAFVVILVPIVHHHGISGLLMAGLMAGIILIAMGAMRLGRFIEFIPYTVTAGFTTGIAIVILVIQLKDFFGLTLNQTPESFFERLHLLGQAFPTISLTETLISLATLGLLFTWPKVNKRIPAPLAVMTLVSLGTFLIQYFHSDFHYSTIANRFSGGIPQIFPQWQWPATNLSWGLIQSLVPSAFAIAMLGAIESLLSAVAADGMAKTRHDPDAELVALGTANLIVPFFGGIAATGAITRTATNIRYGAKSPVASMVHSIFILLAVLIFAPLIGFLPMASLAALLVFVSYHMADLKQFWHLFRLSPRNDAIVLVTCAGLTIAFDMVIGVGVGVGLASLLFMKRMAEITRGQIKTPTLTDESIMPLPPSVLIYEIRGPLFFGAARTAIEALSRIDSQVKVIIFDMRSVPTMDVSGLLAFEETLQNLQTRGIQWILAGAEEQPLSLIQKSTRLRGFDPLSSAQDLSSAVKMAREV